MALGYQNPFYLKQAQQKQQSLYNGKVLLEKHDPPAVYDSEETLELAQESRLKMKQLNKEIKPANYTKINHLSGVFVSQTAKSREELYFSNTSKTANVSKSISIPNEEFSDDTTPSVARKFLNEVKSTIVTLQQAAKFVRDFKSLAKEADESLAKHKALELEIERLLRAVVSQDIMSIVQNPSVVDSSNLQTELERTKERFENCIIKKENEYAKLWNDWYKKCEECKYDKILYDKAYNDMQQKIERLQAQLGDQKGKSKDTPCVSNTLDPLSQKLENKNVELEFQVSEQKDTNKGTSANTKFAKQSILGKPPSSFRPKLYAVTPLPKSTAFPKVGETNALSNPVTSNSVPSSHESTVVNNERVIAPGIFRINPFKAPSVDNFVPNKHVKASVRTKPIIVSQPQVITKNDVNSKTDGFSPKDVKSTTRTRRPQPRNNPKSLFKYFQNGHWSKEGFASPKPSKPRSCLRWSPTGRLFDLKGKIITSSESESQSDCSKGDNACTSNPQEPIRKRFPSSTFSMTGCQNWFDTLLIPLLSEYNLKDKEDHGDNECDT
ncbi:hypothetical protein Tco_1247007 [Tanacetum coccineum]